MEIGQIYDLRILPFDSAGPDAACFTCVCRDWILFAEKGCGHRHNRVDTAFLCHPATADLAEEFFQDLEIEQSLFLLYSQPHSK